MQPCCWSGWEAGTSAQAEWWEQAGLQGSTECPGSMAEPPEEVSEDKREALGRTPGDDAHTEHGGWVRVRATDAPERTAGAEWRRGRAHGCLRAPAAPGSHGIKGMGNQAGQGSLQESARERSLWENRVYNEGDGGRWGKDDGRRSRWEAGTRLRN